MTQKQFWYVALLCNVAFLFLYIFKQNSLMAVRHTIQQQEQQQADLQQRKKDTFNTLQKLQQHSMIKKRAEKELGMRKADLKHVTTLQKLNQPVAAPMEQTEQQI